MTTYNGMQHSYSNTFAQKVMITDRIIMADPYDIAAITALGLDNASKFNFVNTPGRTYSWLEDAYPVASGATNEVNISTDTSVVSISLASGKGTLFHVGDVIQIDTEYMWISAISTDELTVTRNYGTHITAALTHATTSTAYIRYNARIEGDTSDESPWTEFTTNTNASTIMHKEVLITRDDILLPNYGVSDLKQYLITKNMDVLMEQLNKIPYHGVRYVGTASIARSSGGFSDFITTNDTALSSATLLRSHIDNEFEQIYAAGGKTDLILCGTWFQRKINDFYEGFVTTGRDEKVGGMIIKQLMHPITGALVRVVVDRHCQADTAYFIDTRYAGYITIDPFFYEELAKTGDFEHGQTVGEYGFVCAAEKFHSFISGFSTSA